MKLHIIVVYPNGKVECQDCQGYSASYLCAHAVAVILWNASWRGRKGEQQSRSSRGKQTTSMVVPRKPLPSAPSIGAKECENYPDVAQLHELFPALCQPIFATHQAQLSQWYPAVYNPPGFPFHEGRFQHPHASTFQAHTPQARFQAAPLIGPCLFHQDHRQQQERGTRDCRRILITSWHYRKMWNNAMVAATIFPKNFVRRHTTSWSSTSTVGWYAGTRTQGRWCTAQTLLTLITIPVLYISLRKKPCFRRPCTYRPQHLPLPWRKPEGNAESLWTDCEYRLIRNNSTSIEDKR